MTSKSTGLEADTPGVKYLVLRDLLDYSHDDPELSAAHSQAHIRGPIITILAEMADEGY